MAVEELVLKTSTLRRRDGAYLVYKLDGALAEEGHNEGLCSATIYRISWSGDRHIACS